MSGNSGQRAVGFAPRKDARPIYQIAREIRQDWPPVNYAARPYLDAMRDLNEVTDMYDHDSAKSVIRYFLSNATMWRGDVARRVKAELKEMVK